MGWRAVGPPPWDGRCVPQRRVFLDPQQSLHFGVTQMPLPQFHPRSAPLRGRTRVTLCGMTFHSRLDPDPGRSPRGACRVTVGLRGCTVLPGESESYRCAAVLGENSSREGSGAAPGLRLIPITVPQTSAHLAPQGVCGCAGV